MKRRTVMLMLGAAACLGVVVGGAGEAGATCVGPQITLSVTQGAPGSNVGVNGRYFYATCNDTVVNGVQPPPNAPATAVGVVFVQNGRRTPLSTFPANADGSFAVTVAVPRTAHGGPAQFEVGGGFQPVSQTFTVVTAPPELAVTGSGTSRLLTVGLVALACACLLLGVSRRTARTP